MGFFSVLTTAVAGVDQAATEAEGGVGAVPPEGGLDATKGPGILNDADDD